MSTRGNPITPQAPVVVNGWFDRHFATWRTRNQSNPKCAGNPFDDVSQENFSVLPRELAFKLLPQYDKWIQRPASAHNSDNGPRIFTSLNGFPFFESGMKVDKDPKDLRDSVVFVGLPLIAVDAKNPNQKDSISLMVAGSTTITNTGPQRISAGDLVVWDVPTKSRTSSAPSAVPAGVSRSKALFWTLPLNARDDNVLRGEKSNIMEVVRSAMNLPAVKSALTGDARDPKRARTDPNDDYAAVGDALVRVVVAAETEGDNESKLTSALTGFVEGVMLSVAAKHHRRIIGIALSSAEPGENFDILLRGGAAF